jgi:hypothetical protein
MNLLSFMLVLWGVTCHPISLCKRTHVPCESTYYDVHYVSSSRSILVLCPSNIDDDSSLGDKTTKVLIQNTPYGDQQSFVAMTI